MFEIIGKKLVNIEMLKSSQKPDMYIHIIYIYECLKQHDRQINRSNKSFTGKENRYLKFKNKAVYTEEQSHTVLKRLMDRQKVLLSTFAIKRNKEILITNTFGPDFNI